MFYRVFREMVRLALHLFFRRIEVEGAAQHSVGRAGDLRSQPHQRPGRSAALGRLHVPRPDADGQNVLAKNPLLRWLMSATGVVTFHRREDAGGGANLRQNVRSLQICREILAGGGAVCIFPEGISHSDPRLRAFHVGPARLAVDFVRKDGNPGALGIVPVGLLYTEKDRMRSAVWLRFGEPIDVVRWLGERPGAGPAELTAELQRRVAELTLNYQSRRQSAVLTWAAEIVATEGRQPAPLGWSGPTAAEWFRLLGRLQAGYAELCATQPEMIVELTRRIRRYRAQLERRGNFAG